MSKICEFLDSFLIREWRKAYRLKRVWAPIIVGVILQYGPQVLPYIPSGTPSGIVWGLIGLIIGAGLYKGSGPA